MEIEKILLEELLAFLPIYITLKGNCTLIYTKNGREREIEKGIRSVLNQLSKYYFMDLKEVKKTYGNLLCSKNLVPIPFNKDNVFIPVKTRKPMYKNDGAIGYVNINHINKTTKLNNMSIIHLTNGKKIQCLNSLETVNKHINNGHIVKKLYEDKQTITLRDGYSFYAEYDRPATKGDIALLRREILEIKETIR
ncbi:hypothetical protein KQI42_01615 [Tissierella sp. MSJ-40]|uniref:ComK protein n=1 Tax=Tissierella simiarum TaxID=2841534 RepID=A0ABS6E1L4_9FIRM|nr:hypothetical protein [Tissierella simiarum]MBU5436684.1 hypothetical protein [Tissierella simiarum]